MTPGADKSPTAEGGPLVVNPDRLDAADVVVLFEALEHPAVRARPPAFDHSGDGQVRLEDVVTSFEALFGEEPTDRLIGQTGRYRPLGPYRPMTGSGSDR